MPSLENYTEYFHYVDEQRKLMNKLENALRIVEKNPENLKATDVFSKALSDEMGFDFNVNDYGINKISKLVKKEMNIFNYFKRTFEKRIEDKSCELNICPIVIKFVRTCLGFNYDYYFDENDFINALNMVEECKSVKELMNWILETKLFNILNSSTTDITDLIQEIDNLKEDRNISLDLLDSINDSLNEMSEELKDIDEDLKQINELN